MLVYAILYFLRTFNVFSSAIALLESFSGGGWIFGELLGRTGFL